MFNQVVEKMQAPAGVVSASILGHQYKVPPSGIIRVVSSTHVQNLTRHGFTPHFEEESDVREQIGAMEDKEELVAFIEERGGEADDSMSVKKLRRLALEAVEG